jgi:predicted acylesterase/phospholipase RssA/CRP-like cAMP-binding protein
MTRGPEGDERTRRVSAITMITVPEGHDRLALLRSLELLDKLGDDALAAIERAVTWLEVPAGADVFREGDPSDAMYLVVHGRLAIVKRDDGGPLRIVREIAAGQPVGELGLLLDEPRSATVTALRDSSLVRLDRRSFEGVIEHHPEALLPLSRRIAERLVVTSRQARRDATNAVWLVAATSPDVDLSALWDALAPRLEAHGARCLTATELGRACGGARHLEPARAARWLDAQARAGGPVIVLGEDDDAVRALAPNVDRVLVVADAGEPPGVGALEEHSAALRTHGVPVSIDLVLVQDPDQLPRDTAAWLERVEPVRHHHLRRGDPRDVARLARVLTGRGVALALGGGGARAFVHIGAIRALQEAGIPIDFVVGTNVGAVIGAQLALGWEPARMLEENRRGWPSVGRDLTLPFVSLLGGRSLRSLMARMFDDITIENLWLDFRCATIDLSWCRLVTHTSGPLARWARASVSVPGIHPPVIADGRMYVDGGLLRNVPIDIAQATGAGTIIAIDPSPFRRQTVDSRVEEAPTGFDFLLQFLPIVGTGFPSVVSLIYRALSVAQQFRQQESTRKPDLCIEPPVDRFGITDYGSIEQIVEFGYEETQRRLEGHDGLAFD